RAVGGVRGGGEAGGEALLQRLHLGAAAPPRPDGLAGSFKPAEEGHGRISLGRQVRVNGGRQLRAAGRQRRQRDGVVNLLPALAVDDRLHDQVERAVAV